MSNTAKGRRSLKKNRADKLFWLCLVFPSFLICFSFIIIPIIDSVIKSFTDYKLVNLVQNVPGKWNNFKNYTRLFESGKIQSSIRITLYFVFWVTVITFFVGFTVALILSSKIKGARFLRSIMMIPWVVPTVIGALLWMWIFSNPYGLFRYLVSVFTGGRVTDAAVLTSTKAAIWGVIAAALWKQIPLMTLLLLAGLQNVSADLVDAATIDGTNYFQKIRYVILPSIKSVVKVAVSMCIIENFKQYPLFAALTNGGPANSTTTLAVLSYDEAFVQYNYGSGAAVTTIWMLLMIVCVIIYNFIFKEEREK